MNWEDTNTGRAGHLVIMRHGQSEANAAGIVASSFSAAGRRYGLTHTGIRQAALSAFSLKDLFAGQAVSIVSSPLLAAKETARVLTSVLNSPDPIRIDGRLIARGLSEFEGQSEAHRKRVWALDERGIVVGKAFRRVEPLADVADRIEAAVAEYGASGSGLVTILVTHNDVASCAIAAHKGKSLRHHRMEGALPTGGFAVLAL